MRLLGCSKRRHVFTFFTIKFHVDIAKYSVKSFNLHLGIEQPLTCCINVVLGRFSIYLPAVFYYLKCFRQWISVIFVLYRTCFHENQTWRVDIFCLFNTLLAFAIICTLRLNSRWTSRLRRGGYHISLQQRLPSFAAYVTRVRLTAGKSHFGLSWDRTLLKLSENLSCICAPRRLTVFHPRVCRASCNEF